MSHTFSSVRLLTPSREKARENCSVGNYFGLSMTAGKTQFKCSYQWLIIRGPYQAGLCSALQLSPLFFDTSISHLHDRTECET